MTSVPLLSVFAPENATKVLESKVPLAGVFNTPIRLDIV